MLQSLRYIEGLIGSFAHRIDKLGWRWSSRNKRACVEIEYAEFNYQQFSTSNERSPTRASLSSVRNVPATPSSFSPRPAFVSLLLAAGLIFTMPDNNQPEPGLGGIRLRWNDTIARSGKLKHVPCVVHHSPSPWSAIVCRSRQSITLTVSGRYLLPATKLAERVPCSLRPRLEEQGPTCSRFDEPSYTLQSRRWSTFQSAKHACFSP